MKFALALTTSFSIALLTSGCASITGSKTQAVSITATCNSSAVKGASCTATNDKGVAYASTPGTVMVSKSGSDLVVQCEKDKKASNPITVKSSSNANIWGNILFGGPIGAAIDAGTGAGFDYPPTVNAMFESPCPAGD